MCHIFYLVKPLSPPPNRLGLKRRDAARLFGEEIVLFGQATLMCIASDCDRGLGPSTRQRIDHSANADGIAAHDDHRRRRGRWRRRRRWRRRGPRAFTGSVASAAGVASVGRQAARVGRREAASDRWACQAARKPSPALAIKRAASRLHPSDAWCLFRPDSVIIASDQLFIGALTCATEKESVKPTGSAAPASKLGHGDFPMGARPILQKRARPFTRRSNRPFNQNRQFSRPRPARARAPLAPRRARALSRFSRPRPG